MLDFDENALITLTQSGETEAFGPLVEKYQHRLYTHIKGRVKDIEIAKDLTQDTWLKALRAINTFQGDSAFSSWIYRIAGWVWVHLMRRA